MTYTIYPHLEEIIPPKLLKQERSEFLGRSLQDVRRDNSAPQRARTALPQAAVSTIGVQSRPLETNSDRSKKHSYSRQTLPATTWLTKPIMMEVDRIAQCDGLTRSRTIAVFVEEGVKQRLHTQHAVLLTTVIEQAIAKQMAKERSRFAALLVRIAFEVNQNRTLTTNVLGRQQGMNPEKLTNILDASYRKAKQDITHRSPQIEELIGAVEKWLNGEEKEKEEERGNSINV